jgi:hypothetical protein
MGSSLAASPLPVIGVQACQAMPHHEGLCRVLSWRKAGRPRFAVVVIDHHHHFAAGNCLGRLFDTVERQLLGRAVISNPAATAAWRRQSCSPVPAALRNELRDRPG